MRTGLFSCYHSAMLDFRAVLLAITAAGNIGAIFFMYFRRKPSLTTTLFSLFLLSIVCWAMLWFYYFVGSPIVSYYALKISYIAALSIALTFYLFSVVFPDNILPAKAHLWFVVGICAALGIFFTLPGTLVVSTSFAAGNIYVTLVPFHYLLFTVTFVAFYILSMGRMWLKSRTPGISRENRIQLYAIVGSASLVGFLGIYFDLILGSPYVSDFRYLWTGPLFTSCIAITTMYAIFYFRLFNTKVVASELFVFFVWAFTFVRMLLASDPTEQLLNGGLFILLVIVGLLLIRSVNNEVEQREKIEELSNQKSEFMTFASHEIRNPITAMRGYASLIVDGTVDPTGQEVKDVAAKIMVEGNDVLQIISQYLNKSKLELGKISYSVAPFDLGAAVSAIVDGYFAHAKQKGLTLQKDIDTSHRFIVRADEGKTKEVIGNLIDNSLKYTRHGGITVAVERHGVAVRVAISDTGVGIPAETLPELFKKFSRADAQKVNLLGTGIGLYLAKTFIEAQGGRIWAESEGKDKGSRFIIEFPTV